MNKKIIIALLLCALVILSLFGCNDKAETTAPSDTAATTEAPSSTAEVTVTAAAETTVSETSKAETNSTAEQETEGGYYYAEEPQTEAEVTQEITQRDTYAPSDEETQAYTEAPQVQTQPEATETSPENTEDVPENSVAQGAPIVLPDDIW